MPDLIVERSLNRRDSHDAADRAREVCMHGDERVGLQLGQRDVFRVEGRRSAQLVGNVPCPAAEDGIAEQADGEAGDACEMFLGRQAV